MYIKNPDVGGKNGETKFKMNFILFYLMNITVTLESTIKKNSRNTSLGLLKSVTRTVWFTNIT